MFKSLFCLCLAFLVSAETNLVLDRSCSILITVFGDERIPCINEELNKIIKDGDLTKFAAALSELKKKRTSFADVEVIRAFSGFDSNQLSFGDLDEFTILLVSAVWLSIKHDQQEFTKKIYNEYILNELDSRKNAVNSMITFGVKVSLFFERNEVVEFLRMKSKSQIELIAASSRFFDWIIKNNIALDLKNDSSLESVLLKNGEVSGTFLEYRAEEKIEFLFKNGIMRDFRFQSTPYNIIDLIMKFKYRGHNGKFYELLFKKGHIDDNYYTLDGENRFAFLLKYGQKSNKFPDMIKKDTIVTKDGKTALEYTWENHIYDKYYVLNNKRFTLSDKKQLGPENLSSTVYGLREVVFKFPEFTNANVIDAKNIIDIFNSLMSKKSDVKFIEDYLSTFYKFKDKIDSYVNSTNELANKISNYSTKTKGKDLIIPEGYPVITSGKYEIKAQRESSSSPEIKIDNFLCLDENFKVLDIFNATVLDVSKPSKTELIMGTINIKSSNMIAGTMSCSFGLNLDHSSEFSFPFTYAKVSSLDRWENYVEAKNIEANVEVVSIKLKEVEYKIKRDFESKSYYLIGPGINKKIAELNCQKSDENPQYYCYIFNRVVVAGDFNNDGKLDIIIDPYNDSGHSYYNLYLSDEKGDLKKYVLDMGGC